MRKMVTLSLAVLLLLSTTSYAENRINKGEFLVSDGFLDGNAFLRMNSAQQSSYVVGITDGLLASPVLYRANSKSERLLRICILGKSETQMRDTLLQYVNKNPFERDISAGRLLLKSVNAVCSIEIDG